MRTEVETEFFRPYLQNSVFGQNFSVFFSGFYLNWDGSGDVLPLPLCACVPVDLANGPCAVDAVKRW
jgi:hypothetical protein